MLYSFPSFLPSSFVVVVVVLRAFLVCATTTSSTSSSSPRPNSKGFVSFSRGEFEGLGDLSDLLDTVLPVTAVGLRFGREAFLYLPEQFIDVSPD